MDTLPAGSAEAIVDVLREVARCPHVAWFPRWAYPRRVHAYLCMWCFASSETSEDDVRHRDDCPATRARALLAAIEGT